MKYVLFINITSGSYCSQVFVWFFKRIEDHTREFPGLQRVITVLIGFGFLCCGFFFPSG